MGLAQQGWRNANGGGGSTGGLSYQGVWNASTNTPTITSGVGTSGDYYVVDVAGNTNIDGITDWEIGDWIIFNGTVWQKIDNSDQVSSVNGLQGAVSIGLNSVLSQNNSTGANDIIVDTGQNIIFNNNGFIANINEPTLSSNINLTLPSSTGTIALISDIKNIYNQSSTIGAGRVLTLTDSVTFTGGTGATKFIQTLSGNTITAGTGTNPTGFSTFGDLSRIDVGTSSFLGWGGMFLSGSHPAYQATIADSSFLEIACNFVGVDDFKGTFRPYWSGYYTSNSSGTKYTGFQADINGEQLYTQRNGIIYTSLSKNDAVLFVNPSGYIKATTYSDLASQLGNPSLDEVLTVGNKTGLNDIIIDTKQNIFFTNTDVSITLTTDKFHIFKLTNLIEKGFIQLTGKNYTFQTNENEFTFINSSKIFKYDVANDIVSVANNLGGVGMLNYSGLTAVQSYIMPNKTGTIALTSDIQTGQTYTITNQPTASRTFDANSWTTQDIVNVFATLLADLKTKQIIN